MGSVAHTRRVHVLTLIADPARAPLLPATIARVRAAIGGGAPDILSPDEAADIPCGQPPDPARVAEALEGEQVDAMVVPAANRRKRLLVSDMDSTIVTSETLDELAAYAGLKEQVAEITRRSMNGEMDFATALRERVAMLRGLKLEALERTGEGVRLMPGARALVATMRAHGARTVLVTGGFSFFSERVAEECGFDLHRANVLLDDGAALTGAVREPILDRDAKRRTLLEQAADLGIGLDDTLAVGDGANDLAMLAAAGMGVAFHATPIVAASSRLRVDHCGLRALLFAQGFRAEQFIVTN